MSTPSHPAYVPRTIRDYEERKAATDKLVDSPALRAARSRAYRQGEYTFRPPDVCANLWDEQAWCNWVRFNEPDLNGYLPYTDWGTK